MNNSEKEPELFDNFNPPHADFFGDTNTDDTSLLNLTINVDSTANPSGTNTSQIDFEKSLNPTIISNINLNKLPVPDSNTNPFKSSKTPSSSDQYTDSEPPSYEQFIKGLELELKDAELKASMEEEGNNLLETLLKKHIIPDVNTPDKHGKALIHYAAENHDAESLKILLEQKDVDVNLKDKKSATPLHICSEKGYTECVRLLLAHKNNDVNAQEKDGRTPLHYAAQN